MEENQQRIGQHVGDYRLLKWLGGGGFGNVYLAEHIHDHDQVAIKVLQMRLTDATHLRFFLNEASMFRLRHPHIMPLLNFGLSRQDELFLVMDYAPKGTLRDRHPKGSRVPLSAVIDYVTQMASALQYAHEQHVVHRDVKPENMLLKSDDVVLLSDFGIATAAYSTQAINMSLGVGGTVPYMAPEQMDGKPRPASDQYALAVVTYEWLTGRCPFVGTPVEVVVQHTNKLPPPLRGLVSNVPLGVEEVLFKALAKNPKERFSSVQDFADALQEASTAPGLLQPEPNAPLEGLPPTLLANTVPPSLFAERLAMPSATHVAPSLASKPLPPLALKNSGSFASSGNHSVMPSQFRESPVIKHQQSVSQASFSNQVVLPETSGAAAFVPAQQSGVALPIHKSGLSRLHRLLLILLALLVIGVASGYTYSTMMPTEHDVTLTNKPTVGSEGEVIPTATPDVAATATAGAAATATVNAIPTATATAAINAYNNYVGQNGSMFGFDSQHTHANPYEHILRGDNLSHLHKQWVAPTGGAIFSSPVVANGTVYVGSDDNKLYALDAASGQQRWVITLSGSIRTSPAVENGLIYIVADNKLYALDTAKGQLKWSVSLGGSSNPFAAALYFIHSSPVVANGFVYVGSFDNDLYAFDAANGQLRWGATLGDVITSSPAVANGLVYVGALDGRLYALDAFSGEPKWTAPTGEAIDGSSPAVANGLVYVGSDKLYAFDAQSGAQKWVAATGEIRDSSPAVVNGMVYIGSRDFKLYAFDALSGQPRWVAATKGMINASPTVANGVVYVGSLDDSLYAFDAATGRQRWVAGTGDSIYSSPAVVNGMVYVGSDDRMCYAFSL